MRVVAFACCLAFGATPALAQRADLPPAEKVNEVLDSHPSVAAALARVEAARARGDMLRKGPHEVTVSGSYIRRTVDREGGFDEFDTTALSACRARPRWTARLAPWGSRWPRTRWRMSVTRRR
jgi:outer membrane protein, heavy metal efflux system